MIYTVRYRKDMDFRFRDAFIEADTEEEFKEKAKRYSEHNDDCWWWESTPEEVRLYEAEKGTYGKEGSMTTTKQQLKETYRQFLCELGSDHPDTRHAKRLYDTYCIAEKESVDKACELVSRMFSNEPISTTQEQQTIIVCCVQKSNGRIRYESK